ncbi:MAG: folylpolyglutamate synthase/dihydrofolate synthase family protein [Candidatus Omnitrophota bacterium]|nr:bifunctional folylpolyglutamate synthase/dihydrofolate synthase [Candidatus Omnitrophota bacterium]MBU1894885.1 bifunctional folylpolyglutamate synthase/dihydrofolate synthase [Candidatus Omnitrophota bacterium]
MKFYSQIVDYLQSFINYESIGFDKIKDSFYLEKLFQVLKKAGNPQNDYKSIHVVGTKGKGSCSTFISFILREAGYNVGLFTSPHLISRRERIQVNNKIISESDFEDAFNRLQGYLGKEPEKIFTFFEIYTLIALLWFSMKKVDFAVIEAGLGGRLDATNVMKAEFCAISSISYDHIKVLGETLPEIAMEKVAVIKKNAYCVTMPQKETVMEIIQKKCVETNAVLSVVGRDINYEVKHMDQTGSSFDFYGKNSSCKNCRINMPGCFQVPNCTAALGICEYILKNRQNQKNILKKGMANTFIPGRMEVLSTKPYVLIDGAQNADSAMNLKKSVEKLFDYDKLILILGVSKDKDVEGICRNLTPIADEIILTRAVASRAMDPFLIRGYIRGKRTQVTGNVKEALGVAFNVSGKHDMILVTGSFFVISEVREMVLGRTCGK